MVSDVVVRAYESVHRYGISLKFTVLTNHRTVASRWKTGCLENNDTVITLNIQAILWTNSADDKLMDIFLFFQSIGFDILCKLSPKETICIKCQNLFPGKKIRRIF